MAKILVVEDDKKICDVVCDCLKMEKHTVESTQDGTTALDLLQLAQYDLVVLDLMLPGMSGLEVCKELRNSGKDTAVLMLTGRDSVPQKEEGFEVGADDYLTKPFHVKELIARVKALLRRTRNTTVSKSEVKVGDVSLDLVAHRAYRNGEEVHLTPKEFGVLEFLIKHKGNIFSAEALIARVWPTDNETSAEMIRSYIKRLRQKLDVDGRESIIRTVHKVGYSVEDPA